MNFESKLCRVCLECDESDSFIDIFVDDEGIADKIFTISAVKILKQDESCFICKSCLNQLNAAITFRQNCLKANEYFQSINPHNSDADFIITETVSESLSPTTNEPQKYQCTKCAKLFTCRYYLQKHEYVRHTQINPNDYFECDNCNYKSKTKSLMKARPSETFQCKFCGKICRSSGALYGHEKTHKTVALKDYLKCPHCDKSFKEKRLLKNHVQLVHEKSRMKQCYECGFIATCSGSLNKHRKAVHLKIRNHICDECKQGFATNQQLLRHHRTHSGVRPYPCFNSACDKMFADSHGRKRHMMICSYSNKS
ncbi:zinc finger protein interacting with ribonucleoprotein K-like [Chironomus tepperi]|uniref:zinc finger protein interacting with ribonucleoprotein K-like n=1 Tax=Chironomus tepperi TaxID=113505 RepID=UPI00391F0645